MQYNIGLFRNICITVAFLVNQLYIADIVFLVFTVINGIESPYIFADQLIAAARYHIHALCNSRELAEIPEPIFNFGEIQAVNAVKKFTETENDIVIPCNDLLKHCRIICRHDNFRRLGAVKEIRIGNNIEDVKDIAYLVLNSTGVSGIILSDSFEQIGIVRDHLIHGSNGTEKTVSENIFRPF